MALLFAPSFHAFTMFIIFLFFEEELKGKAKAEDAAMARWRVAAPERHAKDTGIVAPAATTIHADRAR